ncbi:uncharacterized protein [Epargyreus clarus]
MAVKRCCIEKCKSCSTRREDIGVTYHKFPKDVSVRESWVQVTRHTHEIEPATYVCSRHFCMKDFQIYQGTKYVLKSGAVPSIFPWNPRIKRKMDELDKLAENICEDKNNLSSSSKESEPENLEAIKKFIKDNDKSEPVEKIAETLESLQQTQDSIVQMETDESTNDASVPSSKEEMLAIASSVMDIILDESTSKIKSKKESISPPPSTLHSDRCGDKGTSSVSLSVGSKVEARDFAETWYAAEIVEVDYDEMEVLVRYESIYKKPEEWICVNSPRLRPVTDSKLVEAFMRKPKVTKPSEVELTEVTVKEEDRVEEKSRVMFVVGERCLARWRDNRRFTATIQNDLGNGSYEIIFDDGFQWKCSASRLSKLKGLSKADCSSTPRACSTPSPTPDIGPSTSATSPVPYHTHLFDPTRDYLGSKSERRELKRKLNIKEIFNIGQKQRRKEATVKDKPKVARAKKPRIDKSKVKIELKSEIKIEKKEIPDAIASIIGTVTNKAVENIAIKEETHEDKVAIKKEEPDIKEQKNDIEQDENIDAKKSNEDTQTSDTKTDDQDEICDSQDSMTNDENKNEQEKASVMFSDEDTQSAKMSDGEYEFYDDVAVTVDPNAKLSDEDAKNSSDPIQEEETKLQNFEMPDDVKHEEVMDRIKEAITKLEDGLNRDLNAEIKEDTEKQSELKGEKCEPDLKVKISTKESRKCLKLKKKLRLLQQERAEEIGILNSKLEQMRMEIDEMKIKKLRAEALEHLNYKQMPESALPADEWCCKWVNGEPVGTVVEVESEGRLDIVNNKIALPRKIVQVHDKRLPEGWKKLMIRRSLGHSAGKWDVVLVSPDKKRYHTKTEMRHFLESNQDAALKPYEHALLDFAVHLKLSRRLGWVAEDGATQNMVANPLPHKRKKLRLKDSAKERRAKKRKLNAEGRYKMNRYRSVHGTSDKSMMDSSPNLSYDNSTLEDGYVYVGSFKVQVIDNLLRCPAEGCFKNFRNNTLLQMHIKHYHRDMCKMLGATPKVLDLAYARTVPTETETKPRHEPDNKIIKVKLPKPVKRLEEPKLEPRDIPIEPKTDISTVLPKYGPEKIPRSLDSPMMRAMQQNRPIKRPRVLLPVRRPEPVEPPPELVMEVTPEFAFDNSQDPSTSNSVPSMEVLDFETAISTHTVTKPMEDMRKKRKVFATISKAPISDDEDMNDIDMNSDVETRSSFPGSGTPDSKTTEVKSVVQNLPVSSESNEDSTMYMYTETGERIKLERMKREEIINCHCGFREEDGLMVQCELCLCWQHALCHNIQREADVPQKYTCYICLNPRRGRRSQRFLHDQDRLYEGLLPGARQCDTLRRSHDISANLLKIADALHALKVLYHVATKKNHPKLYLWAKDWEEPGMSTEPQPGPAAPNALPDLLVNKENVPVCGAADERLGALLGGLLANHAGPSAEMPVCSAAMNGLDQGAVLAPQPEPAIEFGACRERLLRYVLRCLAHMDGRVDAIESEIVELESQQPSFEDDETADYFPRTKQTINMLLRDLDTLQQLGVIT